MFKFIPGEVRHAWWPVVWTEAGEEGEPVVCRIEMRFVLHDDAEYRTLLTETVAELDGRFADLKGQERERVQRETRAEYVEQLAIGWRGIGDANGSPFGWSRDVLADFLQRPAVIAAVLTAHGAARRGERPND